MLCGGTEGGPCRFTTAAFNIIGALSRRNHEPEKASRPFDADRDGFVGGEGAAILVMERLSHARQRGAHIYCELAGYGNTADAYHLLAPAENGKGAAEAMRIALRKARICPGEVDYINAHGTSTLLNDPAETVAIKTVFGEHAVKIPISSTKSMTGHMASASGTMEAIVCVKTIETGWIHPTINYSSPDPACDLDYVPNVARPTPQGVRVAISNAFGLGGHNSCLVFRALDQV